MWALTNFCRWKPHIDPYLIEPVMEIFSEYIEQTNLTVENFSNICWGLSYLTEGDNNRIAKVLPYFKLERIIELMGHIDEKVVVPAVRIVGNIVAGTDEMTQSVLDCGVIRLLEDLSSHKKAKVRQEVYWTVSNIAAGTRGQIQVRILGKTLVGL